MTYDMPPPASEPQKESQVYSAKRKVESAASSMNELITQLNQRLKPVLNEPPKSPEKEPKAELSISHSSAVDWLNEKAEYITMMNGRLGDILHALEL